jgi:hypothetical protein
MTPQEAIQGAIEIISDPNKWTYQAAARTDMGAGCRAMDKRATCWCAAGAIEKAAEGDPYLTNQAFDLIWAATGRDSITLTNDLQGREAAIAMMQKGLIG